MFLSSFGSPVDFSLRVGPLWAGLGLLYLGLWGFSHYSITSSSKLGFFFFFLPHSLWDINSMTRA